jgi:hypothetical protein
MCSVVSIAVTEKAFASIACFLSCRNFNWTFASLVYEDSEYGVKVSSILNWIFVAERTCI